MVNTVNNGTLPFLPDDASSRSRPRSAATGAAPLPVPPLDPLFAGLMANVTAYEDLALEAALRGGRDRVFRALLAHPLVGQYAYADAPHRRPDRAQPGAPHVGVTAAVLAVDAGNSKTDVAVVAPDGTVLATARGGGFQPPVVGGLDAAVDTVAEAVDRALRRAGDSLGRPCLGLPRQRRPPRGGGAVHGGPARPAAGARTVEVRNDTFAILRAGRHRAARRRRRLRRGHQLRGHAPGRPYRPLPGPRAASPATGAAAGAWPRRPCGTRPGPRTAAASRPPWPAPCPRTSGWPRMPALIEALHLEHIADGAAP